MEQTSSLNKVLKVVFVVNLVVLNVLVGYLVYKSQIQNSKIQINPNNQNPIIKTETVDICGPDCQKYIDASLKSQIPSSKSTPTPISTKVVYQQTPAKKVRTVTYVPIPGTGSTMNNVWTDLAGTDFYFNTADYPGLIEVSFEANVKLINGNGIAYFQLADITHGIGVQGSDLQTSAQTSTSVSSGKISFWAGKNLIRVQAKSLTADTAVFDGGRLKVVVEN
ncbi:MAG: hypothetical protein UU93_C0003G0055 [Candidatus Amesbacteria bacterium GW2011_GWA2_42_12]|uniref:Uncharacterized protein n=1 Tax=Candidatus Amesbacteria bacterium GW2011_GWA2_42_12 TaxID=1618356 RepID=A0A0G0Y8G8_9BACT|nr:MAG: hypothetical protein UU93_C0003G0055 [Candidatus Amesbacteria bacterium GW2011_GWA2_42_12]